MLRETLLVFAAFVLVSSTHVEQCSEEGRVFSENVQVNITKCEEPPCILKKKSRVGITQSFIPKKDVKHLVNSVQAVLLIVPLPFIGVHGKDAEKNIFNSDGTTLASWPLKKDTEYIYKNSFPVHSTYPAVPLTVHWALVENGNKITCFTVAAQIR